MQSEMTFGLVIAIFAAVLAINDLVAGRCGDDELKYSNEKTSAYFWYQAKSIKESIVEGQRDMFVSLADPAFRIHVEKLNDKLAQYKKEKREILLGSKAVGPNGYAQAVDGEMGKVIGAKELEQAIALLGEAGDHFDVASLFLQLSLVAGAIGLLIQSPIKKILLLTMIALGTVGIVASTMGYHLVQNYP